MLVLSPEVSHYPWEGLVDGVRLRESWGVAFAALSVPESLVSFTSFMTAVIAIVQSASCFFAFLRFPPRFSHA